MSVEARNLAKKQAAKHQSVTTEDDEDFTGRNPKLMTEDLGGTVEWDDTIEEDTFHSKERVHMPEDRVFDILIRKAEIEMAGRPGRPRDQHKQMQQVAQIFGTTLEDFKAPFQVASRSGGVTLGPDLQQALSLATVSAHSCSLGTSPPLPLHRLLDLLFLQLP